VTLPRHALRHLERHFSMHLLIKWWQVGVVFIIAFVKRIQNDVQDDAMRDAK